VNSFGCKDKIPREDFESLAKYVGSSIVSGSISPMSNSSQFFFKKRFKEVD
jgi:hypothetical protein